MQFSLYRLRQNQKNRIVHKDGLSYSSTSGQNLKTNAEKLLFNSDNLLIGNKGVTSYLSLAKF